MGWVQGVTVCVGSHHGAHIGHLSDLLVPHPASVVGIELAFSVGMAQLTGQVKRVND